MSVICPKGPGDPWRQRIDGVNIYKYPPPPVARGAAGYLYEFAYCWLITALLSVVVAVRHGFAAIQACNPPDTYWLLGRFWKLFGKKFVYDQHDLNPEVFLSRFGEPSGLVGRAQFGFLRFLERMTFRTADRVVSTNESYKRIAMTRGNVAEHNITVVRSGPNTMHMRPVEPRNELRHGRTYMAAYLGIMGPQDGVDLTLRALDRLVRVHGRTDCHLALLGFGDCLDELKVLASDLGLNDYVTFTGRVGPTEIASYLSTADLGLCPDPKSPLNDVSTMNKTMEYMAYGLPIVSFDLAETRVSANDAAVYLQPGDVDGFAAAWNDLLDDDDERVRLGTYGRERVVAELDWAPQAYRYVAMWHELLGINVERIVPPSVQAPASGNPYVDLSDPDELSALVRRRGRPDEPAYR